MTSRDTISRWFDQGVQQRATYLIVVCDTFDYSDSPIYVRPEQSVSQKVQQAKTTPMQRVMEVYNLASPKTPQLDAFRAFNL